MFCERCHKKDSTVHLTEIIKDIRSEVHLCEDCAREIGFNSKISDISTLISGNARDMGIKDYTACPVCGISSYELSESGRTGCAFCYRVFSEVLTPIMPDLEYKGKHPLNYEKYDKPAKLKDEYDITRPLVSTDALKQSLEDAVKEERYEDAAILRDIINEREGSYKR